MVVGAKGSPLHLILSSVYHIDNPTGNISYKEADKLTKNPMVDFTIPLSYGDSYNGFRIVGTTSEYPKLYDAKLNEGELWKESMEVVIGSMVARISNLKIGDKFYGTHGLGEGGHIHDNHDYKVVGILKPSNSVIDKLIITDIKSVLEVHDHQVEDDVICSGDHHDHHDHHNHNLCISDDFMITSMLVKFKSPVGLIQLPRKVNETTSLQAAIPVFEINRLTNLLGFGVQTINLIALIIIPLFLGLFYGLITFFCSLINLRLNFSSILIFSTVFSSVEFLRGFIMGGFPWNLHAYSWSEYINFLQILSFTGTYAFNLLSITLFMSPLFFFIKNNLQTKIILIISIIVFITTNFYYGSTVIAKYNQNSDIKINSTLKIISPKIKIDRFFINEEPSELIKELIILSYPSSK